MRGALWHPTISFLQRRRSAAEAGGALRYIRLSQREAKYLVTRIARRLVEATLTLCRPYPADTNQEANGERLTKLIAYHEVPF
jgi:hypothetical protein